VRKFDLVADSSDYRKEESFNIAKTAQEANCLLKVSNLQSIKIDNEVVSIADIDYLRVNDR